MAALKLFKFTGCDFEAFWGPDNKINKSGVYLIPDPTKPDDGYVEPEPEVIEGFTDSTFDALTGRIESAGSHLDLDRSIVYLKVFGIHLLRHKLRDGVDGFRGDQVVSPKLFNTLSALAKKEDLGETDIEKSKLVESA